MDYQALIENCAPTVAPATMQRIISVESAGRPHAIGYHITKDGKSYRLTKQPSTPDEAVKWAKWLLENGYRFDAGAAQVNSKNFQRLGLTAENVFDPCANIGAGGKILTEFYRGAIRDFGAGQDGVRAAISAYQTGSYTRGWGTGYVQRVTGAAGTKVKGATPVTAAPAASGPGEKASDPAPQGAASKAPDNPYTAETLIKF